MLKNRLYNCKDISSSLHTRNTKKVASRQIVSKSRVSAHGEVYTSAREVNDMCNLVEAETRRIESLFLEPACGTGNFLVEVLERKLREARRLCDSPEKYETLSITAVRSISGIELLPDNVECCRERLFNLWRDTCEKHFGYHPTEKTCKFIRKILSQNIICNDVLALDPSAIKTRPDVVIGNPPYHACCHTNGKRRRTRPVYQLFVEWAKRLNPGNIVMLIPSRWFTDRKGIRKFRADMLGDRHITYLVDFPCAADCFHGVNIKGGVCYFRWERDTQGDCIVTTFLHGEKQTCTRPLLVEGCDVFIRYSEAVSIYKKVAAHGEPSFSKIVSPRRPFGLGSTFQDYTEQRTERNTVRLYANKASGFVSPEKIKRGSALVPAHKVFVSFAYGAGDTFPHQVLNRPFLGEAGSVCTETYLAIGPFGSHDEAENAMAYLRTRFFRFMVLIHKNTQNATRHVYQSVPMQDFSVTWTDSALYKKYNLSPEEIQYIEAMVREMKP